MNGTPNDELLQIVVDESKLSTARKIQIIEDIVGHIQICQKKTESSTPNAAVTLMHYMQVYTNSIYSRKFNTHCYKYYQAAANSRNVRIQPEPYAFNNVCQTTNY